MANRKINRVIYRLWHKLSVRGRIGYIGKDKFHPRRLDLSRRKKYEKNTKLLHRALNKYPIFLWHTEILASGFLNDAALNKAETFYIAKFKSNGKGYNLTDGGEGSSGRIMEESTKKKLREFNTWKPKTPKRILKLYSKGKSTTYIGKLYGVSAYAVRTFLRNKGIKIRSLCSWFKGVPKPVEQRIKMSQWQMGKRNHQWTENPSKITLYRRKRRARLRKANGRK